MTPAYRCSSAFATCLGDLRKRRAPSAGTSFDQEPVFVRRVFTPTQVDLGVCDRIRAEDRCITVWRVRRWGRRAKGAVDNERERTGGRSGR
jgi:hypothetical protein